LLYIPQRTVISHFLLLAFLILVNGCASDEYFYRPDEDRNATYRLSPDAQTLAFFDYKKVPMNPVVVWKRMFGTYIHTDLRIEIDGRILHARYIRHEPSNSDNRKKLVIVLPIYDSDHTYPQDSITGTFLERFEEDTNILRLYAPRDLFHWPALRDAATEEEFFAEINWSVRENRALVIEIRRWLDWAVEQPEIDPLRIGIVGFSIAVPHAVSVMSVDSRIAAAALIMGGGNPHEIFAFCQGEEAQEMREYVLGRFGWSVQTFQDKLEEPLRPINPVLHAGNIHPQQVLYIDARDDHYIPKSARDGLWEALGRPERITLDSNHTWAFLAMTILGFWRVNSAIDEFFENRL